MFVGKAVKDERALIEARTGQPLTEDWLARFRERRNEGLIAAVKAIDGARARRCALIHERFEGRIACASGADRFKVELQLEKCGLLPYFKGRVFSGHELPRSKPFPDVYLAAAAALSVDPKRCAVVEDTVTGVTAGVRRRRHGVRLQPTGGGARCAAGPERGRGRRGFHRHGGACGVAGSKLRAGTNGCQQLAAITARQRPSRSRSRPASRCCPP